MKRKIIAGLFAGMAVCSSALMITACGSSETIDSVTKKLESVVARVEDSEAFAYRNVKTSEGEFFLNQPTYNDSLIELIKEQDITDEYGQLFYMYDAVFGYSYSCINYGLNVLQNYEPKKEVKIDEAKANMLNSVASSLKIFEGVINEQENSIFSLVNYLENLNDYDSVLAYNALYNYKKEYSNFVSAGLNLASNLTKMINEIYDEITYEELNTSVLRFNKSETKLANLQILKNYSYIIHEQLEDKIPANKDDNQIGFICERVFLLQFKYVVTNVLEIDFTRALTQEELDELIKQREVFSQEQEIMFRNIKDFDLYKFAFDENGDFEKLTLTEKLRYNQILEYYMIISSEWECHYFNLFK